MKPKDIGAILLLIVAVIFFWFRVINKPTSKQSRTSIPRENVTIGEKKGSAPSTFLENFKKDIFLYPVNSFLPDEPVPIMMLTSLSYNPFKLPPGVGAGEGEPAETITLKLSAIINIGKNKIAIINNKRYKEGDMIGPILIKRIERNKVYIQTPLGEEFLQLYSEKSSITLSFSSPRSVKGGKK
ncbi:MAG: hypothetical protein J7L62_02115 [Candidatus Aminicenantes bacterium]|nr:hypothetical protein [Candidatus Aminicenantes bacterium]